MRRMSMPATRFQARLVRSILPAGVLTMMMLAADPAAATTQTQIKAMSDFVDCLNQKIAKGSPADITSTLQCLPNNCTMTLTMSDESAQPACILGAGDATQKKCQLPRVILNCPGPPPFIPSYSLCPGPSNHLEIGVEVSRNQVIRMIMGDINLAPGPYTPVGLWQDVISKIPDSKKCNDCHNRAAGKVTNGAEQSEAIDTFGISHIGTELAPLVIDTNEPGRTVKPGPGLKAQTLAKICECIDSEVNNDLHPLAGEFVVQNLCHGLLDYRTNRGWR